MSEHCFGGIGPVFIGSAGFHTGEKFDAFFDGGYGIDVEPACFHGFHHFFVQHQVLDIGGGDEYALVCGQALGLADTIEALNLLVDAADGLNLSLLIDRAGHGQALADGKLGQCRQDGIKLCAGGAVAVDHGIGLLERQAGGKRQRPLLSESLSEEALEDHDALGVRLAAQFGFPLDVQDAALAGEHGGGDARRLAERVMSHLKYGQSVDLAGTFALRVDEDGSAFDHLLNLGVDAIVSIVALFDRLIDMIP